jgi:hypothetical protein
MIAMIMFGFEFIFLDTWFGGIYRRCGIALYSSGLGWHCFLLRAECMVYLPSGSLRE